MKLACFIIVYLKLLITFCFYKNQLIVFPEHKEREEARITRINTQNNLVFLILFVTYFLKLRVDSYPKSWIFDWIALPVFLDPKEHDEPTKSLEEHE